MDLFYIIVLTVAIIILIIILAFIGIGMKYHGSARGSWPPVESTCPDYWNIDSSNPNNCLIPPSGSKNTGSIYNTDGTLNQTVNLIKGYDSANNKINFNDPYYTACNKQLWSKNWGVYWDGYTNYNGC